MKILKKIYPALYLALFYGVINILLRIVLLFHPITQSTFTFTSIAKMFVLGSVSDILIFGVVSTLFWLYFIFLSDGKYTKPYGYIIFGILVLLCLYIASGKSILNEYGGSLPEIGLAFVGLKTILFGLLLFTEKHRKSIRFALYSFTIFLFVLLIIQNAVSEFFFWNEFGVRYNFIAVDYLVYTNTVIGNIMESYPVVPLFTGVGIIALLSTYFIIKKTRFYLDELPTFAEKIKISAFQIVLLGLSLFVIPKLAKLENSSNVFANELQSNGIYKFYLAFTNSELDFDTFYLTLPQNQVAEFSAETHFTVQNNSHKISALQPELKKNVVLITIESLSADFMKHYGNTESITPFLDKLMDESLVFSNLYATGNRTVRGLEAVTLCIPPTPGESIVKRKDNKNKFSTGSVFKSKGYATKYLYGGDAYFDNMRDFFGGNGYDIVDIHSFKPEEITFSNIWGVCDEDMANKAIQVMNEEAKSGKPFFNHWMTVSNHRPFTYPQGKIDIPADSKSRNGGVKYTDFALKNFFEKAAKKSWFKNTVFVIVADHCASSSGKTELPMEKYRIPAMIYAPGFVKPAVCNTLMSQIDLMPTALGLLNFSYDSKFFGQNVFDTDYEPRAFIATYQDLGYIKDNALTIISPVRKVKQFTLKAKSATDFEINVEEILRTKNDINLLNQTIANYQLASEILKKKKYQAH